MKLNLSIIIAALLLVSGCEAIKDATSIKVDTGFEIDFPVVVTPEKSTADQTFSVTEELSLAENEDLDEYLSRIEEINLSDLVITVSGLSEGQTIHSLSLDVSGLGNVVTITNITMSNNSFTPGINETILDQMGNKLRADQTLTMTVSGSASGPMTFVVSCNMDARVVVETI